MARLHHDNIAEVRGFAFLPELGPVLVSKYYSRGSLATLLKQGLRNPKYANDLQWDRRLQFAYDIASAMICMHTKNPPVIHRDLKACNCFVDGDWNVYVGDFGLSKGVASHDHSRIASSSSIGATNPRWLAPEIRLEGEDNYSTASDVYSYGMLLFEMLTMNVPWPRMSVWTIRNIVPQGQRPELPHSVKSMPGCPEDNERFAVSGALEDYLNLMQDCWAQEPHDRPANFKEVHKRVGGMIKLYEAVK